MTKFVCLIVFEAIMSCPSSWSVRSVQIHRSVVTIFLLPGSIHLSFSQKCSEKSRIQPTNRDHRITLFGSERMETHSSSNKHTHANCVSFVNVNWLDVGTYTTRSMVCPTARSELHQFIVWVCGFESFSLTYKQHVSTHTTQYYRNYNDFYVQHVRNSIVPVCYPNVTILSGEQSTSQNWRSFVMLMTDISRMVRMVPSFLKW